ncbi:MAG: Nitroreductase family protein [Syntrophus sp. PtaU1.Bin208]|nr:MAG: Nitroreductase family protein [Syntrophus sp. PtaU1.Bin208]
MTVIEVIKSRKSCRTYSRQTLEPWKLTELRKFLASNREAPFGSRFRFHLLDFDELEISGLKTLTTYGVIQGARYFIVGAVEKGSKAMEDFGYGMERNILQATSMELGTCILGGTFKRSGFGDKINIRKDEVMPVISPIGYPRDKMSFTDRVFRLVAASDQRKPWEVLFYHDNGDPLSYDDPELEDYKTPLECVRLAPSASNKQPWRIVWAGDSKIFHFYLRRTPGYEKLIKEIKLQNIDMGIALCHFELSAKELGLKGIWSVYNLERRKENWEYIASWVGH